jgi:glycosyltransferase involved in cell wall biosynthesis
MQTILIVSDNLQGQINGVVTTFINIEKQATMNGYIVKYITPSNFHHFNAPGYPEVKLSIPVGIGKLIKSINPDYIHISTEGPIGMAVRNWCCFNRYNYNTSYHTKYPEFVKKIYGIPEFITYAYVRWFHERSNLVLTTTVSMVNELKDRGFKVPVIPWTRGVDRSEFVTGNPRITNGKINLLSVGRVSKEKGIEDLCELSANPVYTITVVGDGPHRAELEDRYPLVNFVGYKHGCELAEFYNQADVFVFTSRVDTFGIVIIEALAMGCPVAAYPETGPLDIIEHGIDGVMDENIEYAITECLKLDRVRVELNSRKWTWENCWDIFKTNLVSVK